MTAVIDTNGLLRSIPRDGSYRWLYDAFADNQFIWIFSNEILSEYIEMVGSSFSASAADLVSALLLSAPNHQRYEPSFRWGLIADDPDDNKFTDCAIGANVDYLVSDDRHILNLRRRSSLFPPIPIITFGQFRQILKR